MCYRLKLKVNLNVKKYNTIFGLENDLMFHPVPPPNLLAEVV